MWEDPIVDEVRKIRENLDAKFNFKTKDIFKDIRKRQDALGSRLVRRKKKIITEKSAAPDQGSNVLHPGR